MVEYQRLFQHGYKQEVKHQQGFLVTGCRVCWLKANRRPAEDAMFPACRCLLAAWHFVLDGAAFVSGSLFEGVCRDFHVLLQAPETCPGCHKVWVLQSHFSIRRHGQDSPLV